MVFERFNFSGGKNKQESGTDYLLISDHRMQELKALAADLQHKKTEQTVQYGKALEEMLKQYENIRLFQGEKRDARDTMILTHTFEDIDILLANVGREDLRLRPKEDRS